MDPFILVGFTVCAVWLLRRHTPAPQRLSKSATVLLAIAANAAFWLMNWPAAVISEKVFLLAAYGIENVKRGRIHIIGWSRTKILISNGDVMGKAASQTLQFMTLVLWFVLLVGAFFGVRAMLAKLTPGLHRQYSNWFREYTKPR